MSRDSEKPSKLLKRASKKHLAIALFVLAVLLVSSVTQPFEGLIGVISAPTPVVAPDPGCTLANQIVAANSDQPVGRCPAGNGVDVIHLSGDIVLHEPLPIIESEITIVGKGHSISGDEQHRIFQVRNGDLVLEDVTLINGKGESGGAILILIDGKVTLRRSAIHYSEAASGGAIHNRAGDLVVLDSVISHNHAADQGGGIYSNGGLEIKRSSISGNSARDGGGLYSDYRGAFRIVNSTFSGNRGLMQGGAIYISLTWRAELTHVTIKGNVARVGGGVYANDKHTELRNSILTSNSGGNCVAKLEANINNIIADGHCTPLLRGNALLYPSADFEGLFALREGSSAIDAAHSDYCPATDQRGVARPQGGACDIGAYEFVFED